MDFVICLVPPNCFLLFLQFSLRIPVSILAPPILPNHTPTLHRAINILIKLHYCNQFILIQCGLVISHELIIYEVSPFIPCILQQIHRLVLSGCIGQNIADFHLDDTAVIRYLEV